MNEPESQRIKEQIDTWLNRAALAYRHGNSELSKQALHKRWEYQKRLAELENTGAPEQPQEPEQYFNGWEPARMRQSATRAFPVGEIIARAFGFGGSSLNESESMLNSDWMVQNIRKEVESALREPGETDEQFVRKLRLFYDYDRQKNGKTP